MLQLLALIITDITSVAILWITSTFRQSVRSFSSYVQVAPKTCPRTSPSSSSLLPAHSLSPPISAVPTPTLDSLRVLCRPVFEEEQLNNPMLAWVGVFQSQHPDSGINFLVGFDGGVDADDLDSSYEKLEKRLLQILCREVNLVEFIQDDHPHVYAYMEALLTAETIWGPPLWKLPSREAAKRRLKRQYETTKEALQAASRLKERLISYKVKFESLKNKTVRLSILEDALLIITAVQTSHNPFHDGLRYMIPLLKSKKNAIRAGKEGAVESSEDLRDIWKALFIWKITDTLEWMMYEVEQMFNRAGFKP